MSASAARRSWTSGRRRRATRPGSSSTRHPGGRCDDTTAYASGRLEPVPPFAPQDADEAHALARSAAQVVGEGELPAGRDRGDLALAGFAATLETALEEHAQAGGADGMSDGLEAAVGIDGQLAGEVERPRE